MGFGVRSSMTLLLTDYVTWAIEPFTALVFLLEMQMMIIPTSQALVRIK